DRGGRRRRPAAAGLRPDLDRHQLLHHDLHAHAGRHRSRRRRRHRGGLLMAALLPLFVGVPLLLAAILVVVPNRALRAGLLIATPALTMVGGALTIWATSDGTVLAHNVGLWPTGIAIPFAVDTLSALMLTTTSLLIMVSAWFAVAVREDLSPFFAPLVLVLAAGVFGALLTVDVFNLFVF